MNGADFQIRVDFVECTIAEESVILPLLDYIEYQIGDEAIEIQYTSFKSADATNCNYEWNYALTSPSAPIGGADLKNYAVIDTNASKITIFAKRNSS